MVLFQKKELTMKRKRENKMSEPMQRAFEKSDRSVRVLRGILLLFAIIIALGGVVAGIVLWANSQDELYVGLGCACFFGAPLLAVLMYQLEMVLVWALFDLKVLRTMATESAFSDSLLKFGK